MKTSSLISSILALWDDNHEDQPTYPFAAFTLLNATNLTQEFGPLTHHLNIPTDKWGSDLALRVDIDPTASSMVQWVALELQQVSLSSEDSVKTKPLSILGSPPYLVLGEMAEELLTQPGVDKTLKVTAFSEWGTALGHYSVTFTVHVSASSSSSPVEGELLPSHLAAAQPVRQATSTATTTTRITQVTSLQNWYINAGGGAYNDSQKRLWEADALRQYYITTTSSSAKSIGRRIYNTVDGPLYQSSRQAGLNVNLRYEIGPVITSAFQVTLHFSENGYTTAGSRVFQVWVEGVLVQPSLDVYAAAPGGRNPYRLSTTTRVTDGSLSINLIPITNASMINAIQVEEIPGSRSATTGPIAQPSRKPSQTPSLRPTTMFQQNQTYSWSIRINCGGPAYNDTAQNGWEADATHAYYNSGGTYTKAGLVIKNTLDSVLYHSERFDNSLTTDLQYNIPVPANGLYWVALHFAEIYFTKVGKRVFDVWVENAALVTGLDLVARVGPNTALILETNATVLDGFLTINFVSKANNPKISAIAVSQYKIPRKKVVTTARPSSRPSTKPSMSSHPTRPQMVEIRLNCGGDNYTGTLGTRWEADGLRQFYNYGKSFVNTAISIAGTSDPFLYQSERYDDSTTINTLSYAIPVSTGTYQVQLHFAEIYYKKTGARVFDVWVENTALYPGLDIFGVVGYAKALVLNTTARVVDGFLTINLVRVKQNPKISAIAVIGLPDPKVVAVSQRPSAAPSFSRFPTVRINAGGPNITDPLGAVWEGDDVHNYYVGGLTSPYSKGGKFQGTITPDLFRYQRYNSGAGFSYVIPVPHIGSYKVALFFAEITFDNVGSRIFHIDMEGVRAFSNVDIAGQTGGSYIVLQLDLVVPVSDGFLNINFIPLVGDPKVNAIQVERNGPHLAHSVPGGPYYGVDFAGSGQAVVAVDGDQSHTHALGQVLTSWVWSNVNGTIGFGQQANLSLPVGANAVDLTVTDTAGNVNTGSTTVNVYPQGYPLIVSLSPNTGDVIGGNNITISGYGFNFTANQTTVFFGTNAVTGSNKLWVVNPNTIVVLQAPSFILGIPVNVYVTTPVGSSNAIPYTYVAGIPIQFTSSTILKTYGPSSLAFGPDGNLYVGTVSGLLFKITFDDYFNVTSVVSSAVVANSEPGLSRTILGVALDPMDRSANPSVYVSHSTLFHGSCESFRGLAINGKVSRISGASLTIMEHVVTGLPVSDHDHAVNGLEFDDNGDLHIQIGGNTNAGIPGALSGCGLQEDNVLSASSLVAHLSTPGYDGNLTYNNVTGNLDPGKGVEVFAPGLRNSFDLVLHSNGNFYATDNGPNGGYGAKSTSCSTQSADPYQKDKLVLLQNGRYYGHPNRPRAAVTNRPDQCVWRPYTDSSDSLYIAPIAMLESSSNGITEFHGEHFMGQLRYNLILGKYKGPVYRIILSANGTTTAYNPVLLWQDGGLDVTQGPDGSLFTTQIDTNSVKILRPVEPASTVLTVKTVFTRRGPVAGGYEFRVYGQLLNVQGAPTVLVGNQTCPVTSYTATKVLCTMPAGNSGTVDVQVTSGTQTSTMLRAFRYITGVP